MLKYHYLFKLAAKSLVVMTAIPALMFTIVVEDTIATHPSIQMFSAQIPENITLDKQTIQLSKAINILDQIKITDDSLLTTALRVPALTLAQGYQFVNNFLEYFLPLAEEGFTIHTPAQIIGPHNAQEVKLELELRRAIYEAAIRQRGFQDIAGKYNAQATSSCQHIQSMWADGIREEILRDLSISQDDFKIQLIHQIKFEDQLSSVEISGTIVESALIFEDPMNSDFSFVGEITSQKIIVRPDVDRILDAWPTNFGFKAPDREDLSKCIVTLSPI